MVYCQLGLGLIMGSLQMSYHHGTLRLLQNSLAWYFQGEGVPVIIDRYGPGAVEGIISSAYEIYDFIRAQNLVTQGAMIADGQRELIVFFEKTVVSPDESEDSGLEEE